METWNAELRAVRESRGISREELADRCGLSVNSLRSYELGRRRPTREHLSRILKCLKLDGPPRNLILVRAGFASDAPVERFPEPSIPTKEAVQLIRQRPWPAFLLNAQAEILAVSGAAWRLLGVPDRELSRRRSVLTLATRSAIATRAENWDELVSGMIQFFKAAVPEEASLDTPGPYLASILKQLTRGDAALMERFVELWKNTPPFRGRMTGLMYRCLWKAPSGTMGFTCHIGCLNTEIGLYAHTWIPADARSHLLLEGLLAD